MHEPKGEAGVGREPATLRSEAKQRELSVLLDTIVSSRSSRDQIRVAVKPVCEQARKEMLDASELVKIVKHSFAATGLATTLAHAGERQQALDRIISVCIDEYYAGE